MKFQALVAATLTAGANAQVEPRYLSFLPAQWTFEARVGCPVETSFYIPTDPHDVMTPDPVVSVAFSRTKREMDGSPFIFHYDAQDPACVPCLENSPWWNTFTAGCTDRLPDGAPAPACFVNPGDTGDFAISYPRVSRMQKAAYIFPQKLHVTFKNFKAEDAGDWWVKPVFGKGAKSLNVGYWTKFTIKTHPTSTCPAIHKRVFGPGNLFFADAKKNIDNVPHSNAISMMGPYMGGSSNSDRYLIESIHMTFAVPGTAIQGKENRLCKFPFNEGYISCDCNGKGNQTDGCQPGKTYQFSQRPSNEPNSTAGNAAWSKWNGLPAVACAFNEWCREGIEIRVYDMVNEGTAAAPDWKATIDQSAYILTYSQELSDPSKVAVPMVPWPREPLTVKNGQYIAIVKKLLSKPVDGPQLDSELIMAGTVEDMGYCVMPDDKQFYTETEAGCSPKGGTWVPENWDKAKQTGIRFFKLPKADIVYDKKVDPERGLQASSQQNILSKQLQVPFATYRVQDENSLPPATHKMEELAPGMGFSFNVKLNFYDTWYPPVAVTVRPKGKKVVVDDSGWLMVLGILLGSLAFCCCLCCCIYSRQAKRLKERRMFMASMLGTSFNISSETGEPLPPNWYEEKTPEGNIYYYNPTTQESMWDVPTFG